MTAQDVDAEPDATLNASIEVQTVENLYTVTELEPQINMPLVGRSQLQQNTIVASRPS